MDADKALKKSIFHQDHQSLSMVTHHFVVRLHSLLPSSNLQGRCVSHMDDDPFFHPFPFLSRTASLNSWPWHGSGTGTTGVPWHEVGVEPPESYFSTLLVLFVGRGLILVGVIGNLWPLIFLVKNNNIIFLNDSFPFICFPGTHFENALILNDPIPSLASLDWSDTVKM